MLRKTKLNKIIHEIDIKHSNKRSFNESLLLVSRQKQLKRSRTSKNNKQSQTMNETIKILY